MNIEHEIKGGKLILTIDISDKAKMAAPPSKSGKTRVIATTSGFVAMGDIKVSLNATIPPVAQETTEGK